MENNSSSGEELKEKNRKLSFKNESLNKELKEQKGRSKDLNDQLERKQKTKQMYAPIIVIGGFVLIMVVAYYLGEYERNNNNLFTTILDYTLTPVLFIGFIILMAMPKNR